MNDSTFEDDWSGPAEPSTPGQGPARPTDPPADGAAAYSRGLRSISSGGDGKTSSDDWRDSDSPQQPRSRPSPSERSGLPAVVPEKAPAPRRDYPTDAYAPISGYGEVPPQQGRVDFRRYAWLVFKHRWLLLGSAGIFLCLGLVVTFLTTPLYRANTTIQISRQADRIVATDDTTPREAGRESEFYQTQYELLKSRSLAERVVAKLGLQDNPKFLARNAPSGWSLLVSRIFGRKLAEAKEATTPSDITARQKAAAAKVLGNLIVTPVRSSSIVRIGYQSPDPVLASRVANALADSFIAANLDRRFESSAYARTFLEERLQQLKVKLEESEKELVAYADRQKIVGAGDTQNLAMTNLTAANDALTKAKSERLRTELLWKQIDASTGLGIPQILENESIKTMRTKRSELAADYQDKLSFFKPAFPEMKKLRAQIDELERQVNAEVELIKQSIKAQYDAALSEEQSLVLRVEDLKSEVTDFRNRNIRYTILQREVDTNRSLYDGLLQRYKEIGVAGGVGTNNVSIVDRADIPASPYTPKLSRNLAFALVIGLLFGAAAAFAREQFDDTFKSPDDVEEQLGLPLLGIIPLAGQIDDLKKSLSDPRSHIAEAYRSLRTALQFSTANGVPASLLITSSRPSEGKSTTALVLARNFAELGSRVLLIDADLRKPGLHQYLGTDDGIGLTNYLAGTARPPDLFQSTDLPNLTFLASGPLPPNPAELLAGPKMLSLLTIGAQKFDLVLVDGPPVVGLADAPILASIAEGTLLVIDAGNTRRNVAKAALKRLNFARAQMVGAVINKLATGKSGYNYGYGYGYDGYYGIAERPSQRIADGRPIPPDGT